MNSGFLAKPSFPKTPHARTSPPLPLIEFFFGGGLKTKFKFLNAPRLVMVYKINKT